MFQVRDGNDPLLKRPFSLFRTIAGGIQLLYRIQGKGTTLISRLASGDVVSLLGPLGNAYPAQGALSAASVPPMIIAGGVGIASVFPLIESIHEAMHQSMRETMKVGATVIYGARTAEELLDLDELKSLSKELHVCTDDGSSGEKGNVLDLLKSIVPAGAGALPVLYACGPRPMLRAVAEYAGSLGAKAYLSMEEHMACGIGACLGCVVKTKSKKQDMDGNTTAEKSNEWKYQRVCMEGPVFDAEDIVW